ncbi:MAG: ferredoxin, partial [Bacteroidales bacterium]|nr:ferredoxin [Bacteroidales bacterium]
MKKVFLAMVAAALMFAGCNSQPTANSQQSTANSKAVVYLTRDISPEALVNIYKALGVEAKGRVAVKISTGEGSNHNYLKPELIKDLVILVDGTIVECNTAYSSGPNDLKDDRNTSANHWEV